MATETVSGTDPLAAGRAALDRAAWEEARANFEAATADGGTAEAGDGLSQAVWWLGDVEAALASYPGAGQVAVQPWTDEAGDKHLVGYLTPGTEEPPPGALREHLAALLPAYMIPSFFVALPELPLNSSGKVNRRALPPPDPAAAGGPVVEPRTATERVLAGEIMGPLLHQEQLGVNDDFFEQGGNSLQAAQLISKINRRFEVEISLADFFLSPTPAHLAKIVDAQRVDRMGDDELFAMLESMSDKEVNAHLHEDSP